MGEGSRHLAGSVGASESVSAHDLTQRGEVGRAAGRSVEDGRDLAEVVGTEDAGRDDCQRLGVEIAGVVEVMDGAAGDVERLAGSDIGRRIFALQPVDRLVVAVVAVPCGDLRARRNVDRSGRR